MKIIETQHDINKCIQEYKHSSLSIGFTPTLGCLHLGHVSLIKNSLDENDINIVSIFVNPIQFTREKYLSYPRNLDKDISLLTKLNIDVLFLPSISTVYKNNTLEDLYRWKNSTLNRSHNNFMTKEIKGANFVRAPIKLSSCMDGYKHMWHYDGVVTVVNYLLDTVKPNNLYLGEKDPQQLTIIKEMVKAFNIETRIKSVKTLRENDNVPFSSRNTLLTANQRSIAAKVCNAIRVNSNYLNNNDTTHVLKNIKNKLKNEKSLVIDNLCIVDKSSLMPIKVFNGNAILYISYYIDDIRLTDCIYFTK